MSVSDTRVLVTGGAGFIGSALVGQLVNAGHRVDVVDSLVNGQRENLAHLPADRVKLLVADVRAPQQFREALSAAHTVYHLACLGVRHSLHAPLENHEVNATGTLALLAAAHEAGVSRFVHVSSSEVYGTALTTPMDETHPTQPSTVYGASKLAGEAYARAFHRAHGMPVVIVRPFNAYGPRSHHEGDSGEVIPKFLLRALAGEPLIVFGDGAQQRDFTFVEDIAGGIMAAGGEPRAVGETLNLGSGRPVSILELARMVASVVGRDVRIELDAARPGDVMMLHADAGRARRVLGFAPTVSLEEGLQRTLSWYRGLGVSPEALLRQESRRNWEARRTLDAHVA